MTQLPLLGLNEDGLRDVQAKRHAYLQGLKTKDDWNDES